MPWANSWEKEGAIQNGFGFFVLLYRSVLVFSHAGDRATWCGYPFELDSRLLSTNSFNFGFLLIQLALQCHKGPLKIHSDTRFGFLRSRKPSEGSDLQSTFGFFLGKVSHISSAPLYRQPTDKKNSWVYLEWSNPSKSGLKIPKEKNYERTLN